MNEPTLLKSKEVSQMLRVPLSTLYRLCKLDKVKAVKIGKQWRFKQEDVLRYLNAGIDFYNSSTEKRRYPRINCHIPCRFKVFIPDTKDIESKAIIKNISAGGAFIELPLDIINNIHTEDPLDLKFTLELNDENMLVESQARIVRQNNNSFGIKFKNLDSDIKNRILDYAGD